jgi:addiction module HigA family antidote
LEVALSKVVLHKSPGQVLAEEFMESRGLSQNALARAIDVPPRRINEIILGKRKITADTDLRLCQYFALPPGFWLTLQVETDLEARGNFLRQTLEKMPSAETNSMVRPGIYARLAARRKDLPDLQKCVDDVLENLEKKSTSENRPGMLLGRIQSGKTRAFIGVIAKALDRKFDIAVVLTKGTKTLAAQTVARLSADFSDEIDADELLVMDIMKPPGRLIRGDLKKKLIIVVKKQVDNLDRLCALFKDEYPGLAAANVLLVDDEADLASIRFVKKTGLNTLEQGKIAGKLEIFRELVKSLAFLQVTATPYSLYLQPENYDTGYGEPISKPMKPAFTVLLPMHKGYVGGDTYFGPKEMGSVESYLFVPVLEQEQNALRQSDRRRIKLANVLETPLTTGLTRAITTFVTAVCIRQWQQREVGARRTKYAMVIHNDTQRAAHDWQEQVVNWIAERITSGIEKEDGQVRQLFNSAFDDLEKSIQADEGSMPDRDSAFEMFAEAFQGDEVVLETVNSDNDVLALLDDKAELRLRTAFNIFIGGSILDRGITIPNLIAFFYGRNPNTAQADTVLQHSRMYGNRPRADVAVTRLYTSHLVYNRMYKINSFESTLREAFELKAYDQGVVFICADDSGGIRSCAPDKLYMSDVISMRPGKMYLPTGIEPKPPRALTAINRQVEALLPSKTASMPITIDMEHAIRIITAIEPSFTIPSEAFDWDAMKALMIFYAKKSKSKVDLFVERGRKLDKDLSSEKSGLSIVGTALRRTLQTAPRSRPALVLLQQEGSLALNWTGEVFWWPVLAAPLDVEPCIFASKIAA